MAVYTVSISDGTTLSNLAVSAGRGPKGDGFTGGTYDASTGIVTFTSNDGIGFSTDDLRGNLSEPGPIGDVTPNTGAFTTLSSTGDTVIGGNLTVEGTTTTVDSTTVAIADKNIELAKDATTAAEADGGGITLNGAAATITYSSANDYWALNKGLNVSGNVSLSGTVDGRDVAADGSKLDGIESNATADQTALEIKTAYESNADTNAFTDAEQTKLSNIEALADVTDTTNVTAAGALMDSELTSEASVKALDQGVSTTDSPDFAGLTVDTDTLYVDSVNNRVGIGTSSPATALDVTGTVTADGLTVDGSGDISGFLKIGDGFVSGLSASTLAYQAEDHSFKNIANNKSFLTIDGATGDISFYEDTGTTPKFFWDASAESLGIGTSSPSYKLEVEDSSSNAYISIISSNTSEAGLLFGDTDAAARGGILYDNANNSLAFRTGTNTERMRIDSSGNVGIGTSNIQGALHVGPGEFHTEARRVESRAIDVSDTTNYTDVFTLGFRATYKILIGGSEASSGDYGLGIVEAYAVCSGDGRFEISPNEIFNSSTRGIDVQWNGPTLQVRPRNSASNLWGVTVEVIGHYTASSVSSLTWHL